MANDILLRVAFWFLDTIYVVAVIKVFCDLVVLGLSQ